MRNRPVPKNLILAIVGLAQLMDILDMSIVNVALPSIFRDLSFGSLTDLQWVTSAYVLTYGGFLILGGRAADLFGRRRVFLVATAVFGFASLATGAAQSEAMIDVARAVQGLSAAFMSPAALSLVLTTFAESGERERALGIWGAIGASGAVIGAVLGGVLTTYLGWRWNFFINIFLAAAVLAAATRFIPPDAPAGQRERIDVAGATLVTGALLLLVYGLTQAPADGWGSTRTLVAFAASVVLGGAFTAREARTAHPLMPFGIFRAPNLAAANVAYLGNVAAFAPVFFFPTLYMQDLLGFSPLRTGIAFLPMAGAVGATAAMVSKLAGRIGPKWPLVVGPLVAAAGLVLLSALPVEGSYAANILPGFLVLGLGVGTTMVSATIAATNDAPSEQEGLASALLAAAQQLGFALGYAVLSGVATSATARALASQSRAQAQVTGYGTAFLAAAGIALAFAAFALVFIRRRRGGAVAPTPTAGVPA